MAWTDDKRNAVITSYVDTMEKEYDNDEDRAKSSMEVVKELAEVHGESPNGVVESLVLLKFLSKKLLQLLQQRVQELSVLIKQTQFKH